MPTTELPKETIPAIGPTAEGINDRVGERVRFTGKHGKDGCLSIYVNKRNLYEFETEHVTTMCEPLGCILRVRPTRLPADKVVVVGVLARIICDFGLQYTEHCLYQVETQLYPRLGPEWHPNPASIGGGVFDFETRFVKELPDADHIPFLIKLPRGLPPSVYLRSSAIGAVHWGLNYFLFAYVANGRAVQATLKKQGVEGAWPRILLGRRHSRVFLSFSRTLVQKGERICQSLPPATGQAKRRSFLSGGSIPLLLEASLDRAAYHEGEPMRVTLRLRNSGKQKVGGIRLTLKQLLTVKYAHEPRQVIKSTVLEYEGQEMAVRDVEEFEATLVLEPKYNTNRVSSFQIALESFLPASIDRPRVLAATCAFHGGTFNGYPFGIDKLRIFSVEYYVNVHAIIPWGSNVIVKLPFHLVSNGGIPRNWNVPSNEVTGQVVRKPSLLTSRSTPATGINNNNLISFDGNAIDEAVDDDYHDNDDHDDYNNESGNGKGLDDSTIHPIDRLFPKDKLVNGSVNSNDQAELLTWEEDLATARSILQSARMAIHDAHQKVLADRLDKRSRALQYASSLTDYHRLYLEQLSTLLSKDLVELKSSLQKAASIGGASSSAEALANPRPSTQRSYYAAQATAFRLTSLGNRHVEIVPISWSRDQQEEHLERMALLLDDFELFLVRAARRAWDESALVIDRMSQRGKVMVGELAGYKQVEGTLYSLMKCIANCGLATIKKAPGNNDDNSDSEVEDDEEGIITQASNSMSSLMADLANCFQQLYNNLIERQEGDDRSLLDFVERFPPQVQRYSQGIQNLLIHRQDNRLGSVAFFNWHFLIAAVEYHYLGSVGSTPGRLLLYRQRDALRWNNQVEKIIPARYILTRSTTGPPEEELEDLARQIVNLMQAL